MQVTVNGLKLSYTDEGRGQPLLFIHGFPLGRGAWQKQCDAFRTSYRVIAPDLRGFGESEGKPGTTSMLAASNQDAAMAEQVRGLMASSQPEGVIAALLGMAERPDSTALLSGISLPTLVVTGADDSLIPPAESEKLAAAIPGAQLSVIPGAGHLVAFEQPDAFNSVLIEWLGRHGRSGQSKIV